MSLGELSPERTALMAAQVVGRSIAAAHAADVDTQARFPIESIAGLRRERLLGAAIPLELGGLGLGITALAEIAQTLAESCSATAMIWAMHQIQLACLVRHGLDAPFFEAYLREAAERQLLISSVTSEVGTGGNIRTSIAGVELDATRGRLEKHGSTVSYGAHADALLITARRAADAPAGDQVLVLARRDQTALEQTSVWDALGMRGTCSPAFRVEATFDRGQILAVPFAAICPETMVPYSHILWAACWLGIATDAARRARDFARVSASQAGPDRRLADVASLLQQLRSIVFGSAAHYADLLCSGDNASLSSFGLALEMNQLKLAASELVVRLVSLALSICGMAGYVNQGKFSLGRHLRDACSAGLMINNERLREANAAMLLVHKGL